MTAWAAFRTGLGRVVKYWQVITVLYGVTLSSGVLVILMPALQLVEPARLTIIQDAAHGISAWMVQELAGLLPNLAGMPVEAAQSIPLQELSAVYLFALGGVAAIPLIAWLTGSALAGGMLLIYSEAPNPFHWKRFLWGCWHWWGLFLTVSVFQVGFVLVMLYAGISLCQATTNSSWVVINNLAAVPLLGFLLLALSGIAFLEITRVAAVRVETRNPLKAIRYALVFALRNPGSLVSFYLLAAVFILFVHMIFRVGLFPHLPLYFWPVVLLAQQVFVLLRLFVRSQRLAGMAALVDAQLVRQSGPPGVASIISQQPGLSG
jgi:hypothetical protein